MQRTLVAACTALTLSACGGGGDGGSAPKNQAPVVKKLCTDTRHGEFVTLRLTASDQETASTELLYEVAQESAGRALVLQSEGWNGAAYEATYEAAVNAPWGRHAIPFTVTDPDGASTTAEAQVIVRPRIMPLGDSITTGKYDGYDDADTPGAEPETAGYRKRLWESLQEAGYRVDFVGSQRNGLSGMDRDHEGHNSIQSDGISSQVYSWLDDNPADLVLLHIGTNDLNTGSTSNQTDARIGEILTQIAAWAADSNTPVETLVAQIIDFLPSEPKVAELNNLIAARVQDDSRRIDQYSALHNGSQPNSALYHDSLHPNRGGYDVMADIWFNALEARLGSARCPASL